MKKLNIALLSMAAAAFALPAAAQSQNRLSPVYIGADVGQSKLKDACNGIAGCDDKDTQWGVFAGYRFHPNFAAEVGYHDLGSASAGGSSYDANAWELDGIAAWPIGPVSVYGKLGAFRGEAKSAGTSETNTDLTYGLGLQYDVTRNVGIRGEWQRYPKLGGGSLVKTDADVLRVGALWRFQ